MNKLKFSIKISYKGHLDLYCVFYFGKTNSLIWNYSDDEVLEINCCRSHLVERCKIETRILERINKI